MDKEKEQKKFIKNLEKDINKLEYQITNKEKENNKRKRIKNLKITSKILAASSPYILTAGIVTGIFSWGHMTPFITDKSYVNPYQKKEIDNKGNIYYEEQLEDYKSNNELYYYGKWKKTDNGFYSRNVKVFRIDDKVVDTVNELLEDKTFDKNIKLEDILGDAISEKEERKNNLSKEEIKEDEFIKAIYYDKNNDKFVCHKENMAENFITTIMWVVIAAGSQYIPSKIRKLLGFDLIEDIDKINDQYKPVDTKKLTKQLEIKKENFNLLTGEDDK